MTYTGFLYAWQNMQRNKSNHVNMSLIYVNIYLDLFMSSCSKIIWKRTMIKLRVDALISFILYVGVRCTRKNIGLSFVVLDCSTNRDIAAINIRSDDILNIIHWNKINRSAHIFFLISEITKEHVDSVSNVTAAAIGGTLGVCLILVVCVALFLIR